MGKAYDDAINDRFRKVLQKLIDERFDKKRSRAAAALGVSAAFVSDFMNENRGAGLDLLKGLSEYAPLEVLSVL